MKKKFLLATLLLGSHAWAAPCTLTFSAPSVTISWSQNFNFQAVTLSVTHTAGKACSYAVTFGHGGGASYEARRMTNGASSLAYQLFGDSALTQVLEDEPDVTSTTQYVSGRFTSTTLETQTLTYYVQIPSSSAMSPTYKPSGGYTDSFLARLWHGKPSHTSTPVATTSVGISAFVPKIIDLSLTQGTAFDPTQTSLHLDFGTLTAGASESFNLLVRTNAGYAVSMSSQNGGALAPSSAKVETRVPYAIAVDGTTRALSGSQSTPVTVATGPGQTSSSGVSHPVAVTIGSPANAMAGTYTDVITVTAATTE